MSIKFEKEIKRILEDKGDLIIRSCASKGSLDLLKVDRNGEIEGMQMKESSRPLVVLSSEEAKNLHQIAEKYNIKVSVFVKFPDCVVRCPIENLDKTENLQISKDSKECENFEIGGSVSRN